MDLNRQVKLLNLNDNELEDISDLDLTNVVRLHLSHNSLVSFNALPPLPNCEELYVYNNFLSSLTGFTEERFPKLRILSIDHNPLNHLSQYRQQLKALVPTLQLVDGLYVADVKKSFLDRLISPLMG
jgi:Leucine-rich repeat (LRR) protein